MRHHAITARCSGLLLGVLPLPAAEALPYGHKDFVPSPGQPTSFRVGLHQENLFRGGFSKKRSLIRV